MAMIAKAPESTFQAPPPQMYVARCYRLIDLGTQPKTFMGENKGAARKVMVGWELLSEPMMSSGEPYIISKSYFVGLHEKSALRNDLESWRGKPFTPEEESGFDITKLLGAYCMLNVMAEEKDGKKFTKISAITPLMKGLEKPAAFNPNQLFDLEEPDMIVFGKLSDKLKEIISSSPEFKRMGQAAPGSGFDEYDEEKAIPF